LVAGGGLEPPTFGL